MFKTTLSLLIFLMFCHISFAQNPDGYTQDISGSDLKIDMMSIPGGVFQMGSSSKDVNAKDDESPSHEVEITSFWMSKYEITWDLFYLYLNREIDNVGSISEEAEVSVDIDAISGATIPYVDMSMGMGTGSGLPIVNVTRLAASKFCEWLSAKTGHFYRLPTEAEWEYACRAGTNSAYSFGASNEKLDDHAWYQSNSGGSYHKVGQKEPNAWGLYDMHGNVAELVLDGYQEEAYKKFKKKKVVDPIIFPEDEYPTVVRGGSWIDEPNALRSAFRLASTDQWKRRDPQFPKSKWWHTDAPHVGFRIVRVKEAPDTKDYEKFWGPKEIE